MVVLRFRPLGFYASAMAATTVAGTSCTALSPHFGGGTERTAAAGRPGQRGIGIVVYAYSFLATVENVPVRLLPTVVKTVTAATEIKAAIRPYSIAVAAVSSRHRLTMILNTRLPLKKTSLPTLPSAGS